MQRRRKIKFFKKKKPYDKSSFGICLPKRWVTETYKEEFEKAGPLELYANVDRCGSSVVIMPDKGDIPSSFVSDQDLQILANSLKLMKREDKKANLLYNWLVGIFITGYDGVSFKTFQETERALLKKALEPFRDTSFVLPLGTYLWEGLDFKNPPDSQKSVKQLYTVIMEKLQEIDEKVRRYLNLYCKSNDFEALRKHQAKLMSSYDRQIEMILWAVIRRICRKLDFKEEREELPRTIFYIVLAADAKLLERYKDNYLEIINALLEFSLPGVHCDRIATLIEYTFSLLKGAVNVLLQSAYLKEKVIYKGDEEYREERQRIAMAASKIREECDKLKVEIKKTGEAVLEGLIKTIAHAPMEKGRQIWGYSRIFDRLNRHNKRVVNIAQSAMFGLPSVE